MIATIVAVGINPTWIVVVTLTRLRPLIDNTRTINPIVIDAALARLMIDNTGATIIRLLNIARLLVVVLRLRLAIIIAIIDIILATTLLRIRNHGPTNNRSTDQSCRSRTTVTTPTPNHAATGSHINNWRPADIKQLARMTKRTRRRSRRIREGCERECHAKSKPTKTLHFKVLQDQRAKLLALTGRRLSHPIRCLIFYYTVDKSMLNIKDGFSSSENSLSPLKTLPFLSVAAILRPSP